MGKRLFVGNLSYGTSADELAQLFAGAGEVQSADVINDRATGQSRGFGFVEMGNSAEALKAIDMYNGYVLNERAITVNEARERERTPFAGGMDRGFGGGYGGGYGSNSGRDGKGRGRRGGGGNRRGY